MKVWWCSWYFPLSMCEDKRIAASWPDGMKAWISGERGDLDQVWCGRIEAPDMEAARAKIRSCYGELAEHIEERWEPVEKPAGWQPGDRFR